MTSKAFIIKNAEKFDKRQQMEVLKFLIEINAKIVEHPDGVRINLDRLSKAQIKKLKQKVNQIDVPVDKKFQIR
jgi:hypothetical protein